MSSVRRRLFVILAVAVAGTLVACLEGGPFVPDLSKINYDPSLGVNIALSTETESGLYYRDIVVGTGPTVRVDSGGDTVGIRYRGYLRSGYRFDSNTAPGLAVLRWTTGTGAVVDGMDEGVRGMQLGGVRQIIIPPHLGYGNTASGPVPANSIMIFRVEIVDLDTASTS